MLRESGNRRFEHISNVVCVSLSKHQRRSRMTLRSENARVEAKKLLIHYFRLACVRAEVGWEAGNAAEVEMIVDLILEAAAGDAETVRANLVEAERRDQPR